MKNLRTKGHFISGIVEEGRTWIIAKRGLFRRDGAYFIEKERLNEEEDGHTWEDQIEDKNNIEYDYDDFLIMIEKAREYFSGRGV